MSDVWILKVYRYTENEDGKFTRKLFDAITFRDGGMSSPLGPDEEFEVFVERID